jgi:hypothetical protein
MTIYPASTRALYASMVRFHAGRATHRSLYDAIPEYGAINPASLMPDSVMDYPQPPERRPRWHREFDLEAAHQRQMPPPAQLSGCKKDSQRVNMSPIT